MSDEQKLKNSLGLCMKAGKLKFGYDTTKGAVFTGIAEIILTAADISERTQKEIDFVAGEFDVPVVKTNLTMFDFASAMGKNTGILCVTDSGFAKMITKSTQIREE